MKQKLLHLVMVALMCAGTRAQSFSDNFNRPDSSSAGNGWSDSLDNAPGIRLGIVNNRLSAIPGTGDSGVFRPFPTASPVVLSAVITDQNGYGCVRLRYGTSFAIRSDGTINSGYRVNFYRGDQSYPSGISLDDNGVNVASISPSFQFGYTVTINYVVFNPDGSVQGRISGDGNTFDFSFPPRTINSQGANISIKLGGGDNRCGNPIPSTIDNFQITPAPSFTEFPQGSGEIAPIVPGVPITFGPCNDRTLKYGCALCSVASMLTSFGISTTPADLDEIFKRHHAYVESSDANLCDQLLFGRNMEAAFAELGSVRIAFAGDNLGQSPDAFLTEHILNRGERVILHLDYSVNGVHAGQHYIFVTGKKGSDWSVFDPGWRSTDASVTTALKSLASHQSGIMMNGKNYVFTILGYRTFKLGQADSFVAQARCPVELLVLDPAGRRVGFDSTGGTNIFELADAGYAQDGAVADAEGLASPLGDNSGIKTIFIPSPIGGTYQVLITGTTNGNYTLDVQTTWASGGGQSVTSSGATDVGIQNTNSLVAVPPPSIQPVSLGGGLFTFSWTAVTGQVYQVQYTTSLTETNWSNLGAPLTATNLAMTSTDSTVSSSQKFYRVVH